MPKLPDRPTTPPPKSFQDVIGRRIQIPYSDTPTIGGVPMRVVSREYGRDRYEHIKDDRR